ncbi:hypothetical protein F0562_001841 [Nyssa sinensis]|uniref:Uncharacterized protein n=1 Tax=Nyssa sinensis TaxID=561372 RepID=A0A5J5C436_9ASTE|nr:hypothetical protein F0562_001841 [Nyssa sinensis]
MIEGGAGAVVAHAKDWRVGRKDGNQGNFGGPIRPRHVGNGIKDEGTAECGECGHWVPNWVERDVAVPANQRWGDSANEDLVGDDLSEGTMVSNTDESGDTYSEGGVSSSVWGIKVFHVLSQEQAQMEAELVGDKARLQAMGTEGREPLKDLTFSNVMNSADDRQCHNENRELVLSQNMPEEEPLLCVLLDVVRPEHENSGAAGHQGLFTVEVSRWVMRNIRRVSRTLGMAAHGCGDRLLSLLIEIEENNVKGYRITHKKASCSAKERSARKLLFSAKIWALTD